MKEYLKWTAIAVAVLGVIVTATWLWRDSVWRGKIASSPVKRDTITVVAPYVPPKPIVTPNPAPVTIVIPPDTRKVDSLSAACANKDSLLEVLMSTVGTQQKFASKDPTGLDISGELTILYSPIPREFATDVLLDTVHVPVPLVTETKTVVDEQVSWTGVVISGSVGMVLGAFLLSLAQ